MPGEPRYDPNGPHGRAILRLFQQVETAMAQIIAAAGQEVTLCLMSDHGFGPTRRQVWLNNWLMQHGYLALKPTTGVRLKKAIYRLGLSPASVRERAPERLKLAILRFFERQKGRAIAADMEQQTPDVTRKGILDHLTERLALDFYDVDWSRTRAFSTGTTAVGYIYLNLAGRDPQGIVRSGDEYDHMRAEIMDELRRWEPVGDVLPREAIWHGPQLERAPDIVVRWASPATDARYFQTRISSHLLTKEVPNDYASHRLEGMYLLHGEHIEAGVRVDADILDLTPTFLWLLDQPVPTYMDGQILNRIIRSAKPISYREIPIGDSTESDEELSAEEESAIEESLRNLGYLE
jgi:predicted AlkP superfamily phosphohydrolase/phosphomutase